MATNATPTNAPNPQEDTMTLTIKHSSMHRTILTPVTSTPGITVGMKVRRIGDTFRHVYEVVALRQEDDQWLRQSYTCNATAWVCDYSATYATIRTWAGTDRKVLAATLLDARDPWGVSDYTCASFRVKDRAARNRRNALLRRQRHLAAQQASAEATWNYRRSVRTIAKMAALWDEHRLAAQCRTAARAYGLTADVVTTDVAAVLAGANPLELDTVAPYRLDYV